MKINIQRFEKDLNEIDEVAESDFLEPKMREYYPENVFLHIVLDKFGRDYRVDIDLSTRAHYQCDRCLADFTQSFEVKQRQIFNLGGGDEVDDDIIRLPANSIEIDLDPILSEMVLLNHPIKTVCRPECKGLCPTCGADLNSEQCHCEKDAIDPRWAKLRKLIK